MPLNCCDLARERPPDMTRVARHISYPSESLIVMIWHIDVGFPTLGRLARSGTLPQRRLIPDMPPRVEPLLMAERFS